MRAGVEEVADGFPIKSNIDKGHYQRLLINIEALKRCLAGDFHVSNFGFLEDFEVGGKTIYGDLGAVEDENKKKN